MKRREFRDNLVDRKPETKRGAAGKIMRKDAYWGEPRRPNGKRKKGRVSHYVSPRSQTIKRAAATKKKAVRWE